MGVRGVYRGAALSLSICVPLVSSLSSGSSSTGALMGGHSEHGLDKSSSHRPV